MSQTAPQATINAEPASGAASLSSGASGVDFINLNHRGGDTIATDETVVRIDGPAGNGKIWDAGSASSVTVVNDGTNSVSATLSPASDLSTAGTWTITASDGDGTGSEDASGSYTVTLIDQGSSQIIAEKNVDI